MDGEIALVLTERFELVGISTKREDLFQLEHFH